MDEIWLRVVVAAGAAGAGMAIAWLARRRAARRPRRVRMPGIGPGLVLFTSETCDTCVPAREAVVARVGPDGFTEIVWEHEPAMFDTYAVARVPTLVWVDEDGDGLAWEGVPGRALLDRLASAAPGP